MNVKVVEKWIEDFLLEAEANKVNSTLIQTDGRTPLERINFARHDLKALGLSNERIDRVYKTLFVNSVGF